jgi:hypothetical protein
LILLLDLFVKLQNPTRARQPVGLACIEQAIYRRAGKVLGGADAGEGEVGSSDSRESDSLIVGGLWVKL